jgi:hypothetical protein
MTDYTNFRQRLDAVLRTLDVKQVRQFLIAENQWSPGQPADPEFAMWMMIAGTPTLRDLHEQARKWLMSHGHADDADAVLKRGKSANHKPGKSESRYRASKGENSSKSHIARPQKKQGPVGGNRTRQS